MTTKTTPAPKKASDLTLAELLALLRETVTEALAGIVGYPDEKQEPRPGVVAEMEQGTGADESKPAHPTAGSRIQIVTDEAALSARMARKVGELAVDELEWWIYYIVDEVAEELIGDPDAGLELSAWAEEQLEQAAADIAAGRTIPAAQVAKELGLDWPDDV